MSGLTTIQDIGRHGYQKFGVPVGGFMDEYSARLANYLVGNEDDAPLLEFLMNGPTIEFLRATVFAIGGNFSARLNGENIEPWRSYFAETGDILEVGNCRDCVYGYLAFAGGLKCKKILGSCSTNLRLKFGKIIKEGDLLDINPVSLDGRSGGFVPEFFIPTFKDRKIRVVLGPQIENFTERGIKTFLSSEYEVTSDSDRMGYRLKGEVIEHSEKGADIITDALPLGSIQVPGDGNPIVMMADRPTTGGYPKIAVVARVDIPKIAQSMPGTRLSFQAINIEEAQKALVRRERMMNGLRMFFGGKIKGYRVKLYEDEFTVFLEEL